MVDLGCDVDAKARIEAEEKTASLYAALWDEGVSSSGHWMCLLYAEGHVQLPHGVHGER